MTLHRYIELIYKNVPDRLYVSRFIDYLVNTTTKTTRFKVKNACGLSLISGIIMDTRSGIHYNSLASFYNIVTNKKVYETDIGIFKHIYVTDAYSLWSVLCSINEDVILKFFDIKYRGFLIYMSIKQKINAIPDIRHDINIIVEYNSNKYILHQNFIESLSNTTQFIEDYENNAIDTLYYCYNNNKYVI